MAAMEDHGLDTHDVPDDPEAADGSPHVPDDTPHIPDEIDLKAPYWTSGDVNERLAATFGDEAPRAGVALIGLAPAPDCVPDADVTACRLMLAAIKVSEGSLQKLALWVEAARMDPRDLIAAAEYPRQLRGEGPTAQADDLDDYLRWVSGRRGPLRLQYEDGRSSP